MTTPLLNLGHRLSQEVLAPMKASFVGKDEIIDLLGIALVAGENLFLHGPPGTAKSALVQQLGHRLQGKTFDYLLTRFTEPNELFGPFDLRKLREGELVTNTEGMLPDAALVFLDELLNANSAILNSLLLALNERIFRRGKETRPMNTLLFVGASNRLPEDPTLKALFDRFILRVHCDQVPAESLGDVLRAGWNLAQQSPPTSSLHLDDIRQFQKWIFTTDLSEILPLYVDLLQRIRHAGIPVTDRRAVRIQRLIAASALLSGRLKAIPSDLWVLRYIWDQPDQQEILKHLVEVCLKSSLPGDQDHPQSRPAQGPDAEQLARDLDSLTLKMESPDWNSFEQSYLLDRIALLEERLEWLPPGDQKIYLVEKARALRQKCEAKSQTPS